MTKETENAKPELLTEIPAGAYTVATFAAAQGLSQPEANGAVKFLVKTGKLKQIGQYRKADKGRSSNVYAVDGDVEITI